MLELQMDLPVQGTKEALSKCALLTCTWEIDKAITHMARLKRADKALLNPVMSVFVCVCMCLYVYKCMCMYVRICASVEENGEHQVSSQIILQFVYGAWLSLILVLLLPKDFICVSIPGLYMTKFYLVIFC